MGMVRQKYVGWLFISMSLCGVTIAAFGIDMIRLMSQWREGTLVATPMFWSSLMVLLGVGIAYFTGQIGYHYLRSHYTGTELPESITGPKNTTTEG